MRNFSGQLRSAMVVALLFLTTGLHPATVYAGDGTNLTERTNITGEAVSGTSNGTVTLVFRKINPTRYIAAVNTNTPFWLTLSESFDGGWNAYVRELGAFSLAESAELKVPPPQPMEWSAVISALSNWGKFTKLKDHFLAEDYLNGWYVGNTGNLVIIIEYTPQRYFEVFVLISAVTFIACLTYIIILWRHRRESNANQPRDVDVEL